MPLLGRQPRAHEQNRPGIFTLRLMLERGKLMRGNRFEDLVWLGVALGAATTLAISVL